MTTTDTTSGPSSPAHSANQTDTPLLRVALLGATQSIHTVRWANGLSERGHDVHLLSLDDPSSDIAPAVHQYKLPYGYPLGYFLAARKLRRLLARIQPDLLNTHYATGYGLLARRSGFTPNLLSAWGSDIYDFPDKSRWHHAALGKNLDCATALGATSHAMAIKMRALSRTPVFVTPFGIDEHQFTPQIVRSQSDRIVIGTVKTLEALYGIDTLIHAFAKLKARLATTHGDLAERLMLRIYGGGSQFRMLAAMAERLGLGDCVELKGQIPHCKVPAALDDLDVYVALSRRDSFGVAILEACSSGLPVVVSDADGPAEVVLDGVTGFVVPIEDADAAARKLEALVLDPQLRAAMGTAGRERVREKYSWSHSLDLMQQAYHETLRLHRGAAAHCAR
ncbi:glycosyltransferase [Achromobacter sp.]|uniref:glycosyltransferase n=1 Tax=Achromobacter sp. TaxID=134375 RepID=UPI002588F53C|nr:glycosyltransferase [Achromobacter sp.]